MSQNSVLTFFVNLIMFKPVTVMLCGLAGVPHAFVLLISAFTLFVTIALIGKLKKRLSFFLTLALLIVGWLFSAAINEAEYIYNLLFIVNYLLVLMLFCLCRDVGYYGVTTFWRFALIMTLLIAFLDSLFVGSFTRFDGRNTLIGYDNPLWAGRDLCVVVLFYSCISAKKGLFDVILMLATMLLFLESRAMFLISILLYFIRFTPAYLASGIGLLSAVFYFLVQINPFSVSKRFTEWSAILANLGNIPLFGFGATNYMQVSFTSLGNYAHNFILDLVVGYGIVGLFLSILVMFNVMRLLLLKEKKELHYLMSIPVIYVLAALSQGSLISGMLGLCLIPFGTAINKYLSVYQASMVPNYDR